MCILGAGCLMYWSEAVRSVPGATSEARRERTTVYQSEQAVIGLSPMLNFYISDSNFKVIFSKWYDFYYGVLAQSQSPIVYNNMDAVEQDNLTNSIVSGKFYMINNLEFLLDSIEYSGIILTNSNNHISNCKNICMCNNSYILEPNIIISIYWG